MSANETRRSIFITGGASGIGRATARYFGERGWFVGIADVNEQGMEDTLGLTLFERGTRVMQLLDQVEAEFEGTGEHVDEPAPEVPDLPTPRTLNETADPAVADAELPAGYRRRVDRVSLRKARKRRGR